MEYTYKDRQGRQLLPAGEYVVAVTGVEFGISNGPKTKGAETMEVKLVDEVNGVELRDRFIFASSTEWRVDTFLKSIGKAPKKGEPVEFTESLLLGARGWVQLSVEKWEKRDPQGKIVGEGESNRISAWLSNKPLPEDPFTT